MTADNAHDLGLRGPTTFARLPAPLFTHVAPTPVARPELVLFNHRLARELGLDPDAASGALEVWAGNRLLEGRPPLAQAYAGHQFGHFTRLGDGRAILLAEHLDADDKRWDLQLKGSGPTPYSRRGDGRAALGPMLREYLISEAMHALGVPTTRSLAVVRTGEPVYRERPLPGAILTRVAASHLRVGTFEYAAALKDPELLRALADYAIDRHAPAAADAERPYLELYRAVLEAQAELVAQWIAVGFVHGVMNTDNTTISGETIDYGPCAFIDAHDQAAVFSSIDHHGRYAYGRQPMIAQWNLARFAEALLPLFDPDPKQAAACAQEALAGFPALYEASLGRRLLAKIGLTAATPENLELASSLIEWMNDRRVDHTNTFRGLSSEARTSEVAEEDPEFKRWHGRWRAQLAHQGDPWPVVQVRMDAHNPDIIPRNHHVEAVLDAAVGGDLTPLQRLLDALADPFAGAPEHAPYRDPPPPESPPYVTYCGT